MYDKKNPSCLPNNPLTCCQKEKKIKENKEVDSYQRQENTHTHSKTKTVANTLFLSSC